MVDVPSGCGVTTGMHCQSPSPGPQGLHPAQGCSASWQAEGPQSVVSTAEPGGCQVAQRSWSSKGTVLSARTALQRRRC